MATKTMATARTMAMTMGGTRARVTRSAAKAPVNETRKTDKDLAAQWAAQSESDDEADTRASAAAHRATPAPVRTGTTGIPRNGAMPCWLQDSDTVTPTGDGQHTRAMPLTFDIAKVVADMEYLGKAVRTQRWVRVASLVHKGNTGLKREWFAHQKPTPVTKASVRESTSPKTSCANAGAGY